MASFISRFILFLIIILVCGNVEYAWADPLASNDEKVLSALITELRDFKQMYRELSIINNKTQITVERLRIQEERVSSIKQVIETSKDEIVSKEDEIARLNLQLQSKDSSSFVLQDGVLKTQEMADPKETKAAISQLEQQITRLRSKIEDSTRQLAIEQSAFTKVEENLNLIEQDLLNRSTSKRSKQLSE